jgi:hypothetical protein
MFAWFQRLLPKTGNFFELFEAHSVAIIVAGDAIGRLDAGWTGRMRMPARSFEREHDADDIIREVLTTVRETF